MASAKQTAQAMIRYFRTSEELPAFVRFAEQCGISYVRLLSMKERGGAMRDAWRECEAILCDRLTLGGLQKKYDGSFAKYLVSEIAGHQVPDANGEADAFTLRIRVLEEETKEENENGTRHGPTPHPEAT